MNITNKNHNVYIVGLNPTIDQVIRIEKFSSGNHIRGEEIARFPAGKGMNTARVLSVIGESPKLFGFVGAYDKNWFEEFAAKQSENQLSTYLTPFVGHTRVGVTLIDESELVETHIVTENPPVGKAEVAKLIDYFKEVIHTDRPESETYICFSGRLPAGFGLNEFERMLQIALEAGAHVGVDASGETLRCAANYPLWLLKPNQAELSELVGRELKTPEDTLQAMAGLPKHFENVVVTCGRQGAISMDSFGAWQAHVEMSAHHPISTVGCGDCFYAGLIAGWVNASDTAHRLPLAMRHGVAVATANTRCHQIGDFKMSDVEALAMRVQLGQMDLPR